MLRQEGNGLTHNWNSQTKTCDFFPNCLRPSFSEAMECHNFQLNFLTSVIYNALLYTEISMSSVQHFSFFWRQNVGFLLKQMHQCKAWKMTINELVHAADMIQHSLKASNFPINFWLIKTDHLDVCKIQALYKTFTTRY